jgi:hypothetical protein
MGLPPFSGGRVIDQKKGDCRQARRNAGTPGNGRTAGPGSAYRGLNVFFEMSGAGVGDVKVELLSSLISMYSNPWGQPMHSKGLPSILSKSL